MSAFSQLLVPNDDPPTCNLHWIGTRLGFDRSPAALEQYVTCLIEQRGFPRPLPHLRHGGMIADYVSYSRSRWIRLAVVNWLGDFFPPDLCTAIDDCAGQQAAAEMDRRAAHLALVSNRGGAA